MRYLRQSLDFLLFSNLFVALVAIAQGLVFYHLFDLKPSFLVLAFLFSATLFTYNFSILIYKPKNHQESKYKRVRWIFRNFKLNVGITIMAFISLWPMFFFLVFESKILVVFLAFLSLGYALPLFQVKGKKIGLRNITGLKLFLIAFVWALSVTLLPYLELNGQQFQNLSSTPVLILTFQRFLFFAAITIPFDIRDIFQDKAFSIKTIPILFGEKKAYLMSQIMLFGSFLLLLILYQTIGFTTSFFALTTSFFLAGWLIFRSKWEKNEYYYFFYLDGILILQYLILELFNFIF
jgi:4-hydroxybenzoate polyprenyltransferase